MILSIVKDFQNEINKKSKIGEVVCFQSLMKALTSKKSIICKEYHARSYVEFARTKSVGKKTNGKCELSDLYILTFSSSKRHKAKHTFLQAKATHKRIDKVSLKISSNNFKIDFTQWDLLSSRHLIAPKGKMVNFLPQDILKSAIYDSVGSFGFFIIDKINPKKIEFVFSSANYLVPQKMPVASKEGMAFVNINKEACCCFDGVNKDEAIYSLGLSHFLFHLFSGHIGSPISSADERKLCGKIVSDVLLNEPLDENREMLNSLISQLELVIDQKKSKSKVNLLLIDTDNIEF